MNNTFKKVAVVGLLSVGFFACDNMLDTTPRQSVTPEQALGSPSGMRAVVNSVYNRVQGFSQYGNQMLHIGDILADNTKRQGTSGRWLGQFNNDQNSHVGLWGNFVGINEMNYVLEGVDAIPTSGLFTDGEKNRLRGEMKALRALFYHDMARVYGYEPGREVDSWNLAVPLRLTATRRVADAIDYIPRATNRQVYDQIIADLRDAVDVHFPQSTGQSRIRANRAFAAGLLARVFLYDQSSAAHLDSALARATQARTLGSALGANLVTAANHAAIFRATGTSAGAESLFELAVNQIGESLGVNDSPQSLLRPNITADNNMGNAWFDYVPSDGLLALYDPADIRLTSIMAIDNARGAASTNVTYTRKYPSVNGPYADNLPIMRVSEMVLIQAEVHARKGDVATGVTFLNQLRTNRNLVAADAADFANGDALLEEILVERRRELNFEGHRFFDLKRLGRVAPGKGNLTSYTNVPGSFYHRVLGFIPFGEVENSRPAPGADPVLVQNPGY